MSGNPYSFQGTRRLRRPLAGPQPGSMPFFLMTGTAADALRKRIEVSNALLAVREFSRPAGEIVNRNRSRQPRTPEGP